MERVYQVSEFKKMEVSTMKNKHLDESQLMYQAGYLLTKDFLSRVQPNVMDEIVVVSNSGNNGGDALVMYNELKTRGYNVKIFFVGDRTIASNAYKKYYQIVKEQLTDSEYLNNLNLKSTKYVIDGIFGLGLKRNITGDYQKIIETINKSKTVVYSIDFPSGIHPESGLVLNLAVKANYTGVLGFLKTGNILNQAQDYHGEIKVLDIGLEKQDTDIFFVSLEDINIIEDRDFFTYKYQFGNLAFIGSSKLPGAINLAALSALRNGSGLASVFYDNEVVRFHPDLLYGSISKDNDFSNYDLIVFGPGINEDNDLYRDLLNNLIGRKKLVVDALSIDMIDQTKSLDKVIITPHLGELSRLLKIDKDKLKANPILFLKELAKKGLTIHLKGSTTIVQNGNNTYLLQASNPGLAKAGTGDVLAGLIGSYYHKYNQTDACLKAFKVHTLASYSARKIFSQTGFLASDLVTEIGKVKKS